MEILPHDLNNPSILTHTPSHWGMAALKPVAQQSRFSMSLLPADFRPRVLETETLVAGICGRLTPREVRFLALLGAIPTVEGTTLEIGSFRGKSTVVLARSAMLSNQPPIVAVDPFIYDPTDPACSRAGRSPGRDLPNPGRDVFWSNLAKADVTEHVEFHEGFSSELAAAWPPQRKIRLLWIDGDHSYSGTKTDFDLFRPFLADGAIVALHDVLHRCAGPVRVFAEDMLLSPHFGAAGVCGSIGWGQFFSTANGHGDHLASKRRLYQRVSRLIPHAAFGKRRNWLARLTYKVARARVPHGAMDPADFLRRVYFGPHE